MPTNLDKYKEDLKLLISRGELLEVAMQLKSIKTAEETYKKAWGKRFEEIKKSLPDFNPTYQSWYSESLAIIKLLLPDRLANFISLFEKPKGRKEVQYGNYVMEDYLQGLRLTRHSEVIVDTSAAIPQFRQQLDILKSVQRRFESSLFEIKQIVQADLFDSELESAKELAKHKFLRGAGAIAGVVLEKHLSQICENHNLKIGKKNPVVSEYIEFLKHNNVIDVPQWRFIQHLADIRNLCDHKKTVEPKLDQVIDLIDGVEKITKTIF